MPPVETPCAALQAKPSRDLEAWTAWFGATDIPVLEDTAEVLELLRLREDTVDALLLTETINDDPLMTLKLLAHVALKRRGHEGTDVATVTAALVLLGISPFFVAFGRQASVEQRLVAHPQALQGLRGVLRRSHRAANFALGFAVHRVDPDAAIIHEAALLHDFAEMLLWCHAPELALEIARRQSADPTLRSACVQRDVLGIELADLQQALMKCWHLPRLLVLLGDDRHADTSRVRNVMLAIRLARHTSTGWENAAVPDDVRDIAAMLHLSPDHCLQLLHDLDA
jgi:HD-like signal output (HDOD) protein